jgi:hypothetical protein
MDGTTQRIKRPQERHATEPGYGPTWSYVTFDDGMRIKREKRGFCKSRAFLS